MNEANKTGLSAVIGYPLSHSQSPLLHNTIYHHLDMDHVLTAHENVELKPLIHFIKAKSVELTAVTMPFKEEVLNYLDECSPDVSVLKSANTILQKNGKLFGYNTDVDGIAFALNGVLLHKKKVLVLGAGGAARALGYFLQGNAAQIVWMNRTPQKAVALAEEFGGEVITFDKVAEVDPDVIINTTPIGLYPNIDASPLPNYIFNENQVVFDMVYNPVSTALIKQGEKNGAYIISGLDMFIGQGLKQVEILTGKKIASQELVEVLRELLIFGQRGQSL